MKEKEGHINGLITVGYLWSILRYERKTGSFFWKPRSKAPARVIHAIKNNIPAGCDCQNGYRYICIAGTHYLASRLAHFYVTGFWPPIVDHWDRNTGNNKWRNLRSSTRSKNMGNTKLYKTSTSGLKGVSFSKEKRKWRAHITMHYRYKHLGYFTSKKAASAAYKKAAVAHFENFARC